MLDSILHKESIRNPPHGLLIFEIDRLAWLVNEDKDSERMVANNI